MREDTVTRLNLEMEGLCADVGWVSINKKEQQICGDYFYMIEEGEKHVLVLSDGLGSGVKANILATMTARMLGKMIAGDIPIRDAVKTVADTLPICKVRGFAYSTFTILDFQKDTLYMLQYDNPDVILIRDGKVSSYPVYESHLGEKNFHESLFKLQEGDMLILMSDGITNAGMGITTYSGWGKEELVDFCNKRYEKGISAQEMAMLVSNAALALNTYGINDDMTVMALRICQPQITNLMIGPPREKQKDHVYLQKFFHTDGKHVICGGTTAHIAAEYLEKKLCTIEGSGQNDIPAAMRLEGVDYLTEGQITLQVLLDYCQEWETDPTLFFTLKKRHDPAMELYKILFYQSTQINLFFGKAENEEQMELGITSDEKRKKVEKLISYLEKRGKDVRIAYWAV